MAKHFADANDQIYTLADKPKTGSELERAERLSTLAQEEVARANDRVRKLDAAGADLESASRVLSACCDCVGYFERSWKPTAARGNPNGRRRFEEREH